MKPAQAWSMRSSHVSSTFNTCSRTARALQSRYLPTPQRQAQVSRQCHRRRCRGLTCLRALQLPSEKTAGQVQGIEDDAGEWVLCSCCFNAEQSTSSRELQLGQSAADSILLLRAAGNVLHVDGPALKFETEHPRRRLLVAFNCNKCGAS